MQVSLKHFDDIHDP